MKKIVSLFLLVSMVGISAANADVRIGDFYSSGYAEGFFYPPHNEFDPNPTVFPLSDRPTARYGFDFETTISHAKVLPKAFAFIHSQSYFGDTRPQTNYNYKANPIVMDLSYGAGYRLTKHAQLRVSTGRHINLGNYKGDRLLWSAISARWEW